MRGVVLHEAVPTLLLIEGFRFFFFSNEGLEPPHVHVEHDDGHAKFWLQPVELVESQRLKQHFLERWHEYFSP